MSFVSVNLPEPQGHSWYLGANPAPPAPNTASSRDLGASSSSEA